MSNIIKGVICAGGHATRLGELTKILNKGLLPVYKLPMIYYPLLLMEQAGIKDVMIITGREHAGQIIEQLGSGKIYKREDKNREQPPILSLNLTYRVQEEAGGIAQAIGLAEDFCQDNKFVVILGDNITEKNINKEVEIFKQQKSGARILLSKVPDPQRFGVPRFNELGTKILEILEKPKNPPSNYAVIGVYMYDKNAFEFIKGLKPSARGELEVTDLNNCYLKRGDLSFGILDGWWRDVGTTFDNFSFMADLIKKTGACGIKFD